MLKRGVVSARPQRHGEATGESGNTICGEKPVKGVSPHIACMEMMSENYCWSSLISRSRSMVTSAQFSQMDSSLMRLVEQSHVVGR